mgnify:CR=1 FL=1
MALTKDEFLKKMKQQFDELNDRWNTERSKLQDKSQSFSSEARQKIEAEWEELGQLRQNMKEKIIDLKGVRKSFGVEPKQMIDVMALSGDSSDNIPGVPGIGPKTALSLIQTYGNIEHLYEQIDTITKKKQHENLVQYREQAFLSKKLVKIDTDAPVLFNPENLKCEPPDNNRLSGLFKTLEFRQLQQAFPQETDLSNKNY